MSGGGYGIYAGPKRQWAKFLVQPQAAQWSSREEWHPDQQVRWLEDGRFELRVPCADETEIVMDVLRQGDQVEVIEPPSLIDAVRARLSAASMQY